MAATLRLGIVTLVVCAWVHSTTAATPDISRELDLIQRLGKAETERANQPARTPTMEEVLAASRTIDEYVQADHKKHNVKANPRTTDAKFLRRAYLDIIGRIPTVQEVLAFRKLGGNRRAKIIDKLLNSEGYVSHNFNYWADVLRVKSDMPGGTFYANWVKDALRKNKPWDQMAYQLLTAEGTAWENGATGFYLRDEGMPLDNMALAVETFLGTSLVCAQCHDHPFDLWTQMEFYKMAAFTYGVQTRMTPKNVQDALRMAKDRGVRREIQDMTRPLTYGVADSSRQIRLPENYKYDDATPNQMVKAAAIFNGDVPSYEGSNNRQKYAHWIIDRENPRFTLTIANRIWKKVMGVGLIEPVSRMTSDSKPTMPELMDYLVYKMKQFNYDLKQYQRMLYNTELYQREVMQRDVVSSEPFRFQGPLLRRMSAEQFWDSLMTLVVPEVDYRRGAGSMAYDPRLKAMLDASPSQIVEMAQQRVEYQRKEQALRRQIQDARQKKMPKKVQELTAELNKLRQQNRQMMAMNMTMSGTVGYDGKSDERWKNYPAGYVRASELPSPAPFGHFLYKFGQSDREAANNSNDEANMIQVLEMFNGQMFEQVMGGKSQLMKYVNSMQAPGDKVQMIFLSIYGRGPTGHEKDVVIKAISHPNGSYEYARIVWALLNTREFSFIQ